MYFNPTRLSWSLLCCEIDQKNERLGFVVNLSKQKKFVAEKTGWGQNGHNTKEIAIKLVHRESAKRTGINLYCLMTLLSSNEHHNKPTLQKSAKYIWEGILKKILLFRRGLAGFELWSCVFSVHVASYFATLHRPNTTPMRNNLSKKEPKSAQVTWT